MYPVPRRIIHALALCVALTLVVACGASGSAEGTSPGTSPSDTPATSTIGGTVTVMATGPLKRFLEGAKGEFEAANPGTSVELNLAHVPTLLSQLESGIAADILITPDAMSMDQADAKSLLAGPATILGRIPLVLVVPAGNPAAVTGVTALAEAELRVAICARELPCGKLAEQLAQLNGITMMPDTLEVGGSPGIVTKASTGEIDLGLVLATDIVVGGTKVAAVEIPSEQTVWSAVSAATLEAGTNPAAAAEFLAFLESPRGRLLATEAGISAP